MIEITKLRAAEVQRFKAIRLRSLKENPEAFGTTFETAASWNESVWVAQVEKLKTFLATLDGVDVGVARSTTDESDPQVAWLISMWVAREARGKGVATRLVQAIIEWAKRENVTSLRLDVVDSNPVAIALYERLGFKPTGVTGTFPEPRTHLTEHQRELKL